MIAQTKASPPISFSTLHDDILSEIAQIVKARISSEFLEIVGRKEKLMVRLDEEPDTYKEKSLWAYQQSENPILSSFQALSVANKRLYRICRPMLWEFLSFPSSIPVQMNLWTHCLLPKHGDLIHSLSFQLSYHFCEFNIEAPLLKTKSIQWPVQDINKLIPHQQWQHDNLSLVSDNEDEESLEYYDFRLGSQVISPENVQKVLSCCPNLQTLEFICPQTSEDEPPTILEMVPLVVYLTALVCNLPQLQHLKIQGYWINSIFSKCLLDPLKKLPQLTSVTCSRMCRDSFSDSVEEDQENFVKGLASLDHLTRLSCKQVDAVAPSWTTWSSPANLVDLTIINCKNLVIPDTSDFISTWAPNLTRLKLRFWTHNIDPKAKSELQAFEPHKHQFRLPQLTKLVLHHIPECDFFLSFSNCPNICRFTYHDLKAGSVPTFVDFLTKSNFLPNLKLLSLRQSRCYAKPVQEALHLDLTLVNQFCQQNHIALEVIDA